MNTIRRYPRTAAWLVAMVAVGITVSGCASKPKVDPKLVSACQQWHTFSVALSIDAAGPLTTEMATVATASSAAKGTAIEKPAKALFLLLVGAMEGNTGQESQVRTTMKTLVDTCTSVNAWTTD